METQLKRPLENSNGAPTNVKRQMLGNDPLLKLLVPNHVAGALIGKGGASLKELKEQHVGFVRLSAGNEYYPGTNERVVVLTGETSQLISLTNHIMLKLEPPERTIKDFVDIGRTEKLIIVLTDLAAGLLIGRSGATIKAIQEESQAKLSIAIKEDALVKGERLLTITGSFEQRTSACNRVIEKISSEGSNMANTKVRYDTPSYDLNAASNSFGYVDYDFVPNASYHQESNALIDAKVTVEISVAEELVGPIMGKGGSIVKEMVRQSGGARFKFSDKSGSGEKRTLTITGNMNQAQIAYQLLSKKMVQIQNQNW